MTSNAALTQQQYDEYEAAITAYQQHPDIGFACCSAHPAADAAAALLAEVRRLGFRIAELGEQGPGDRETVSEAAQIYRSLRTVIERTMTEPDRWDGDEDESFHLARYVEWLAAGQPDDDEPDTLPAWLHWRFGPHGQPWSDAPAEDQALWEHQARAVRRAVARGGFKPAPGSAVVAGDGQQQ